MKTIRLKNIRLDNWKGQSMEACLDMDRAVISGRNGCGKTSVYKAFCWLLTGYTDADNVKNHELFDSTLAFNHNIPPAVVTATLDVEGQEVRLKRAAVCKHNKTEDGWAKASGDVYQYEIDGTSATASEYAKFIGSLFGNAELLPYMLMGARFVSLAYKDNKAARTLLESVIGTVSDEDLEGDYSLIKTDLEAFGADTLKDRYTKTVSRIKNDMAKIQTIIEIKQEELHKYENIDFAGLEKSIPMYEKRLQNIDNEIANGTSDVYKELKQKVDNLSAKCEKSYSDFMAEKTKRLNEAQERLAEIERQNREVQRQNDANAEAYARNEASIEQMRIELDLLAIKRQQLIEKRNKCKARELSSTCPYCGQPLSPEKMEQLTQEFESNKAKELSGIVTQGKNVAAQMKEINARIENCLEVSRLGFKSLPLNSTEEAKADVEKARSMEYTPGEDEERLSRLRIELNTAFQNPDARRAHYTELRRQTLDELMGMKAEYAKKTIAEEILNAIATSRKRLREMSDDMSAIMEKADTLKRYMTEKANLVSTRINGRFNVCSIMMYSRQKNGEMADDCIVTDKRGVGYSTLNTSARSLVCVDLQRLFAESAGVRIPVFIDEASVFSTGNLPEPDTQTVYIKASDEPHLTIKEYARD